MLSLLTTLLDQTADGYYSPWNLFTHHLGNITLTLYQYEAAGEYIKPGNMFVIAGEQIRMLQFCLAQSWRLVKEWCIQIWNTLNDETLKMTVSVAVIIIALHRHSGSNQVKQTPDMFSLDISVVLFLKDLSSAYWEFVLTFKCKQEWKIKCINTNSECSYSKVESSLQWN